MNEKFNDLLMLENYEGIYEGSIKEDGDNWEYHAKWYFNELAIIAENYEIDFVNEVTDENIRKMRDDIKTFLIDSLTVIDVRKIGEEIAKELKNSIVDEADLDEACDEAWASEIDGVFTHAYDKLKSLGCKIKTYNGDLE